MFYLTNNDCEGKINIGQVSVFEADGTVIYEGSPMVGMTGTPLTTALGPHQTAEVLLLHH